MLRPYFEDTETYKAQRKQASASLKPSYLVAGFHRTRRCYVGRAKPTSILPSCEIEQWLSWPDMPIATIVTQVSEENQWPYA